MFQRLKAAPIYPIIVCISMAVIGISFSAELIFGIMPCQLCKLQRFLYLALLVTGLIESFLRTKPKFMRCAVISILIANALVASYHIGVQEGIFEDRCELPHVGSKADFMRVLNKEGACSKKWMITGSSTTIWNLAISIVLLVIVVSYRDRKRVQAVPKKAFGILKPTK